MNPSLHLRPLTRGDLAFADSVRSLAGWNQTLADWERFLITEPQGCFLAEWDGTPAGTATTTVYGRELAWIGMVLVHPDYRRRGIGGALLRRCLEHLRQQGVRCVKLDATPLGRPVYEALGFQPEWTLTRWQREGATIGARPSDPQIRRWREPDRAAIDTFDLAVFGASRGELLRLLAAQIRCALVLESEPGCIDGYGLLRCGSQALYLGPVAAVSAEAALRLVDALIAGGDGERIFWDIPDSISAAVTRARLHGFIAQRPLTRMFLGENCAPGDPQRLFALAGPEIG
jgi:GNAT superfamily N-acetyltransferase